MSGGLIGGLVLVLIAGAISALTKRYPKTRYILLALIFIPLIGAVIYLLINPPK